MPLLPYSNNPTLTALSSLVGGGAGHWFSSPRGISIHYPLARLYYLDFNVTGRPGGYPRNRSVVLRAMDLESTEIVYEKSFFFSNRSLSSNLSFVGNVSDLILDFAQNNTALILDSSPPVYGVYTLLLDEPPRFDNYSIGTDNQVQFEEYLSPRPVITYDAYTYLFSKGDGGIAKYAVPTHSSPRYSWRDSANNLIFWTDSSRHTVYYSRTVTIKNDFFGRGEAWKGIGVAGVGESLGGGPQNVSPVGIAVLDGLDAYNQGDYQECWGKGECDREGGFICNCYEGYFGKSRAQCNILSCTSMLISDCCTSFP